MAEREAETLARPHLPASEAGRRAWPGASVRAGAAAGGALGALAVSACCVVPFALFLVGVSGAWIGNLAALAPYKLYFAGPTLAILGFGFWTVYRKPKGAACRVGASCSRPGSERVVKAVLWSAAGLVALAFAFPTLVSAFY